MNYLYGQDYLSMMNPRDRYNIMQAYLGSQPTQKQLNNDALLSVYARNLVRNDNPYQYMNLQQMLNQMYGN